MAPFLVAAVQSSKAGIKAVRQVASVLLHMTPPCDSSTIKSVFLTTKDAVHGAALTEYVDHVTHTHPAFSLVRKMVRSKK